MSITFLSICVLACDFMIYGFFQWTFGEKYRRRNRRLGAQNHRRDSAIEITPSKRLAISSRSFQPTHRTEREVA